MQLINSSDSHLLPSLPQSMAEQTEHDPLTLIRQKPLSVETLVVELEPTSCSAFKDDNTGICLSVCLEYEFKGSVVTV